MAAVLLIALQMLMGTGSANTTNSTTGQTSNIVVIDQQIIQ